MNLEIKLRTLNLFEGKTRKSQDRLIKKNYIFEIKIVTNTYPEAVRNAEPEIILCKVESEIRPLVSGIKIGTGRFSQAVAIFLITI